MKTRLLNNYVTTIIGLIMIVFCAIMVYTQKATAEEMAGGFTTGILFLRSKDSLIALPPKE